MSKTTFADLKEATDKELDKFKDDAEIHAYLQIGYWVGSKFCWMYVGRGSPGIPPPPPPPPDNE